MTCQTISSDDIASVAVQIRIDLDREGKRFDLVGISAVDVVVLEGISSSRFQFLVEETFPVAEFCIWSSRPRDLSFLTALTQTLSRSFSKTPQQHHPHLILEKLLQANI
jgi:hypothetical protein